jgi:hypothetical protein
LTHHHITGIVTVVTVTPTVVERLVALIVNVHEPAAADVTVTVDPETLVLTMPVQPATV